MSSFLIVLISILIIKVSSYLFKKSCETIKINQINMISYIFWVDFLLYSYIGSVIILIFSDLPFNTVIDSITGGKKTKFIVWISVSYTLIAFPLGMILSNFFFKFKSSQLTNYNSKELVNLISKKDSYIKLPLYLLTFLCFLVVAHVFISIGTIPILKIFSFSSEEEVLQLRTSIDSNFPGNVYLKNIIGLHLLPILSYVAFAYYYKSKSFYDLIWFIILLTLTVFMLSYNVAKSPLARYFLGYIFFIVYYKGAIPTKKLLRYGTFVLIFLSMFFIVAGKKVGFSDLFFSYNSGITGRVIVSQISSLYKHFEIFPDSHPHIGIGSTSNLLAFGEPSKRSARIVLETVSPGWVDKGMGGVFNTLFIGEAFANFGIYGIIFMPLYIGFLIKSFHTILLKLPKTPLFFGILIFFSYKSNLTGGVNEYIYNPIVIVLFVIIIFSLVFSKMLRAIKIKNNAI